MPCPASIKLLFYEARDGRKVRADTRTEPTWKLISNEPRRQVEINSFPARRHRHDEFEEFRERQLSNAPLKPQRYSTTTGQERGSGCVLYKFIYEGEYWYSYHDKHRFIVGTSTNRPIIERQPRKQSKTRLTRFGRVF